MAERVTARPAVAFGLAAAQRCHSHIRAVCHQSVPAFPAVTHTALAGKGRDWTADRHAAEPGKFAIRGGGWGNNPYCIRVSYRHANPPDIGLDMVGFRCAGDAGR